MSRFLSYFTTEIYHYRSEQDVYSLSMEMRQKFGELNKWRALSDNLQGRFTGHHQFEVRPKVQVGYSRNLGRPSLHLQGELLPNGHQTEVLIHVVPFPFHFSFLASIVMGFLGLYRFYEKGGYVFLFVALALIFLAPYLVLRLVAYEKRTIRENFVRLFGLRYVKTL